MNWTFPIVLSALVITGCFGEPQITLEKDAKKQFAQLPGKIGITLKNYSGEWNRIIHQGAFTNVRSLPKPPSEAATILKDDFRSPSGLPQPHGYVYWGAYLSSPDKRYMAVSIAAKRHAGLSPGFVIVETQTKKTIVVIKGQEDRAVDGLAWSPDSKFVAALKNWSQPGYLDRFLVPLTGHGDPAMTWYLEIVNLTGDVVAHTKLTSGLRGSWGWVVWID